MILLKIIIAKKQSLIWIFPSRIPFLDFSIPDPLSGFFHPGSATLNYFLPRKLFLNSGKYDTSCLSFWIRIFFIPNPDPGSRSLKAVDPGSTTLVVNDESCLKTLSWCCLTALRMFPTRSVYKFFLLRYFRNRPNRYRSTAVFGVFRIRKSTVILARRTECNFAATFLWSNTVFIRLLAVDSQLL